MSTYSYHELAHDVQHTVLVKAFEDAKTMAWVNQHSVHDDDSWTGHDVPLWVKERALKDVRAGRYMSEGTKVFGPERHDPEFEPVEGVNYTAHTV